MINNCSYDKSVLIKSHLKAVRQFMPFPEYIIGRFEGTKKIFAL